MAVNGGGGFGGVESQSTGGGFSGTEFAGPGGPGGEGFGGISGPQDVAAAREALGEHPVSGESTGAGGVGVSTAGTSSTAGVNPYTGLPLSGPGSGQTVAAYNAAQGNPANYQYTFNPSASTLRNIGQLGLFIGSRIPVIGGLLNFLRIPGLPAVGPGQGAGFGGRGYEGGGYEGGGGVPFNIRGFILPISAAPEPMAASSLAQIAPAGVDPFSGGGGPGAGAGGNFGIGAVGLPTGYQSQNLKQSRPWALLAILILAAIAGYAYWRKKHGRGSE